MKRLFLATISFLTVLTICIVGTRYISNKIYPIIDIVETASVKANEDSFIDAGNLMTEALYKWEKALPLLGTILRNNELTDIDSIFIRSYEYAKSGENLDFQIEIKELVHRLNHLIEKEKFKLKNIF